jgi:hypothetical protein
MRSRDMMTKLDRLPTREEEVRIPDFSLLSPAEQDRANELMSLIGSVVDLDADDLQDVFAEFHRLTSGLPLLERDDPDQGPTIEVPDGLCFYWMWGQKASGWRHYLFSNLGKVQTLRFVELCREYGYVDDDPELSYGENRRQLKNLIIPLAEWEADDRAEMSALLDIAAKQQ